MTRAAAKTLGVSFITSADALCRSERASFTDFTDLSSVALPADESVAAAVSPAAAVTHNSVPGPMANAGGHHEVAPSTAHPFDVSSLTSAASFGVAGFSDCIGECDADADASITALLADWRNAGIDMKAMTSRNWALSETEASMFSIKPDQAVVVITKANQNIGETR
jgi:hypothetical protein